MTRETKQRIHAYEHALPGMKERVFAAVVLLLVASAVAVTTTYAWVTLSRAPEVANITTTLAANGNLEIALSKKDGSMPDEFDIDESITGSRDVIVTNLQWGNLVNLSDDRYGTEKVALRPAQLNQAGLLTSPLWGAVYGSDGRITNLDSSYAYTTYDDVGKQFLVSRDYGVRAISSYVEKTSDATILKVNELVNNVVSARSVVDSKYALVKTSFTEMSPMISRYAQDYVNRIEKAGVSISDGTGTDSPMGQYLGSLLKVYHYFADSYNAQKDVYVALANLQLYQWAKANKVDYVPTNWEDLVATPAKYNVSAAGSTSQDGKISLTNFSQFVKDKNTLEKDISYLEKYQTNYNNGTDIYWSHDGVSGYQLSNIVDRMIDFSKTMYVDIDGTKVYVGQIGVNEGMALLGANGQRKNAYIQDGLLKRFEQIALDDGRMQGKASCEISVSYKMVGILRSVKIYGDVYTTAAGTSDVAQDLAVAQGTKIIGADAVAQDTYGMAIDFWVRTNAEETCLTLEGATTTDEAGNIMSYDGINRIWGATGEATLTTDSTTQGGGSCYIYYADTPEDMMRSLDLLDAMKLAFVSRSGKLLARASMDTVNYYAVNGRITVPLVLDLDSQTTYTYQDILGQTQTGRAITTLTTDNPERITAIVYLDGTVLTNDDVLAAAEIQGQLNLQFGSSTNLKTVGSNDLIDDTRSVTATVTNTNMDYDNDADSSELTTNVTVHVQGADPRNVTAFFVRAINSTQGSRENTMTFTKQSDGTWTSSYTFTAPGTYYLRHVRLDGVDYTLAEPPRVEVSGFSLERVTWDQGSDTKVVRTSENTYPAKVYAKFAASDQNKLPSTVEARFVRTDGNTVNIPLSYNANTNEWVGSATFTTSGVYTLEYLVMDGKYKDLGTFQKTLDLSLGIYAVVENGGSALNEIYVPDKTFDKDVVVKLYDNAGNPLTELEGLVLTYSNGGSATNTVSAPLTWNHTSQCYTGTLPITRAGRYWFLYITMGSNLITKATESPIYTVISPDPPAYDAASACTRNDGEGFQYVPLTNDAVIDNVRIQNAASATVQAVLYNSKNPDTYFYADMNYTGNGTQWYIKLPTYSVDTGERDEQNNPITEQSQEGTWSVAAIRLWDCYYKEEYREQTNPILWVDSGSIGTAYLQTLVDEEGNAITPDETIDFSKLSTTVSGKVTVKMTPYSTFRTDIHSAANGVIALGSDSTGFGTVYDTSGIGMAVELIDGFGNHIPAAKVDKVELKVNYTPPADGTYAYNVNSTGKEYTIALNSQDPESGVRNVSNNAEWQYVGEYQVASLTVTIKATDTSEAKVLTFSPGDAEVGVPSKYTLTTAAPTGANLLIQNDRQSKTVFGKVEDNINNATNGTFLQQHSLAGTSVEIALKNSKGNIMEGAEMSGLTANLKLTYKGGSDANGGYTFTGDTGYQDLTIGMTATGDSIVYEAGSSVLLAGTYGAEIQVMISGDASLTKFTLNDISVYSMKPDVTMALAAGTPSTVTVNQDGGKPYGLTFKGNNNVVNDGRSAVLFASATQFTTSNNIGEYRYKSWGKWYTETDTTYSSYFADYSVPSLQFTLSKVGTGTGVQYTLAIPNNGGENATFTGNGSTVVEIGTVTEVDEYMPGTCNGEVVNFTYKAEELSVVGTQTIASITAVFNGATYALDLASPLSIVQENRTLPSVVFLVDNTDFVTPEPVTSQDGRAFTYKLPDALYTEDGKTSVTKDVVRDLPPENRTEGGGDPVDQLPQLSSIADTDWATTHTSPNPRKLYTETSRVVTNNHLDDAYEGKWYNPTWVHLRQNHYYKTYTQTKYSVTDVVQSTSHTVTIQGKTINIETTEYCTETSRLGKWSVDGVEYEPGATIQITGNSVVRPVYAPSTPVVKQTVVKTTTTDGSTVYNYTATCNGVTTVRDGDPFTSDLGIYCAGRKCNTYSNTAMGSNDNAYAAADGSTVPAVPGYTFTTNALSVGTVRNLNGVAWTPNGTPDTIGSTTIVTEVFDADGNLVSRTEN